MNRDKIKVQLSNGAVVYVEPASSVPEREVAAGALEGRFADVMPSVKALCRDFADMLEDIAPDKASIEFGLSLEVETSGLWAFIGKAGGSSTFQITLEWENSAASKTATSE